LIFGGFLSFGPTALHCCQFLFFLLSTVVAVDAEVGGDVGGDGVGVVVLAAVAGPMSPGRRGMRKNCCIFTRKLQAYF